MHGVPKRETRVGSAGISFFFFLYSDFVLRCAFESDVISLQR